MSWIGSLVGGYAAQQIGKYNAAIYNQQAAYADAKAKAQREVYNKLDRPRILKSQASEYSNFFVSLLTSGVEFRGTPYEAALEFQVNQALDLSIADYKEKIDYILSNFDELNVEINENIRKKFMEGYDYRKLCLYWYNIFTNLNGVEQSS